MASLSLIIPCCNEEDAVRLLPTRLFPILDPLADRFDVELILVDDGSTDATWACISTLCERATNEHWRVLPARHDRNLGLGSALRTGQALATGRIIVTLDADGTYPFALISELVDAVGAGADVATVSPYHRDGGVAGVPAARLLFSRGASLCYRLLVDRRIATYTAMVRAYRAPILAAAIPAEPGFLHVAMTLVEARRRGARVVEIPAILSRRQVGVSKARVARITRAHLRYLVRLAILRAIGQFWLVSDASRHPDRLDPVRHG